MEVPRFFPVRLLVSGCLLFSFTSDATKLPFLFILFLCVYVCVGEGQDDRGGFTIVKLNLY